MYMLLGHGDDDVAQQRNVHGYRKCFKMQNETQKLYNQIIQPFIIIQSF